MFRRIISLIAIITFVSTLGPLPPAMALRPTSEGKSAQAVGDALQASAAAAGDVNLAKVGGNVTGREIVDVLVVAQETGVHPTEVAEILRKLGYIRHLDDEPDSGVAPSEFVLAYVGRRTSNIEAAGAAAAGDLATLLRKEGWNPEDVWDELRAFAEKNGGAYITLDSNGALIPVVDERKNEILERLEIKSYLYPENIIHLSYHKDGDENIFEVSTVAGERQYNVEGMKALFERCKAGEAERLILKGVLDVGYLPDIFGDDRVCRVSRENILEVETNGVNLRVGNNNYFPRYDELEYVEITSAAAAGGRRIWDVISAGRAEDLLGGAGGVDVIGDINARVTFNPPYGALVAKDIVVEFCQGLESRAQDFRNLVDIEGVDEDTANRWLDAAMTARRAELQELLGVPEADAVEIRTAAQRCPTERLPLLEDVKVPENSIVAVPGALFTGDVNVADLAMLPEIVSQLRDRNVTLVISGLDKAQQAVLTGWVGEEGLYFDGSVSKDGFDAPRYATPPVVLSVIAKKLKVANIYTLYPRDPDQEASDPEIHKIDVEA